MREIKINFCQNNVPIIFFGITSHSANSDTCRSKFPNSPHLTSAQDNRVFHKPLYLLLHHQFICRIPQHSVVQSILCKKNNLQKLKSYQFLQLNSSLFIFQSDTCLSKFPKNSNPLAFRKIKTCSTKFPNSFHINNLFVGQLQFLWYNPFCSKKTCRN